MKIVGLKIANHLTKEELLVLALGLVILLTGTLVEYFRV